MKKTAKEQLRGSRKACICCGNEFLVTHGGAKLCDKCRKFNVAQRRDIKIRAEMGSADPWHAYINCCRCGKEVRRISGNQKYCRDCSDKIVNGKANAAYRRRKAEKEKASGKTKAKELKKPEEVPAPRSRLEAEEAALLNYHDLKGKSANRVSAEAKAFGFGSSYGKYEACVQSGMIDRWLADKGITDPVSVLREIKVK